MKQYLATTLWSLFVLGGCLSVVVVVVCFDACLIIKLFILRFCFGITYMVGA